MKRTFVIGGISAGLLASALVATPAMADEVPAIVLAKTNFAAQQVAAFWYGEAKANLIGATPYNVETKIVAKHVSTGGPSPDSKAGVVPAIGDEKKTVSKSKNVNLPKTSGKVFFLGSDGQPHWCTGTSIQSQYRNLVATAGHCVYDTESNATTLDKWVFIPGYYQGKTPWGIYVGKTAYSHYDYDVYEDGDRDYAFVTVYNGVIPTSVNFDGPGKYGNPIKFETAAEAATKKSELENDKTTGWSWLKTETVVDYDNVNPWGSSLESKQVDNVTWDAYHKFNGTTLPNNFSAPAAAGTRYYDVSISQAKFREPAGVQNDGDWYFNADKTVLTYSKKVGREWKYYQRTFSLNYDLDYVLYGKVLSIGLKDVGRLGDLVGGQGLAYNQKVGKPVFVFGYPSGSHPDGDYAYNGKTLKWSYGKTFASAAAIKAEELIGVKSSFTGEGSIGSSWLLNYKSARRLGYLNGVTIGVSDTDKNGRIDTSVSPYFDGELYGVYSAAKNQWSGAIV